MVVFVLWTLRSAIGEFDAGIWGPENAWTNRDFLGAWWLFLVSGDGGWPWDATGQALAKQNWPDASLPIQHHIPNPFDGWILGPLVEGMGFPLWWNGMQLFHHMANLLALMMFIRSAGASRTSALAATLLAATCPVLLHEVAGGRTLSGVVWPGLLSWMLLLRGRDRWAGVCIGLQGLCYIYTGLLFGLVALILRPRRGLALAGLLMLPYLWWLAPVWDSLRMDAPDAGHSSVPLGGLLGGWWGRPQMPERFLFQPLLLAGLALPGMSSINRRQAWIWVGCALLCLMVAMGPEIQWVKGSPLCPSPLAWIFTGPEMARMHHPLRAVWLAAALLAVCVALVLDRLPIQWVWVPLIVAVLSSSRQEAAVPYGVPAEPPGLMAAEWLAENGTGVVDLTGWEGDALALAPVHGLPMLEGLRKLNDGPERLGPSLRKRADGWLLGNSQPGLGQELRSLGFSHVLVVERREHDEWARIEAVLHSDLGPPVFPGVYALDERSQ